MRRTAVRRDVAGDLYNVVIPQAGDGSLVGSAEDHAARFAGLHNINETQSHAGIAAGIRGKHIEGPGLIAVNTGLVGHVSVFPTAVPLFKALQAAFKVVFNIHFGKFCRHLTIDVLDDFAAGLRGVENIADSLFPIIEIVKIFVKHAAHMFQ